MRALGAEIVRDAGGGWRVAGRGVGGLAEPADVLDMGNSGTAARLLAGILASHDLFAVMTGDASLRRRPMRRVIEPLSACGARFETREGGRLPLAVRGARDALPLEYRVPVPSAQVKSAVLLAGLNAPGVTTVTEAEATRDHSENMLRHFGARVEVELAGLGRIIRLHGQPELMAADVMVPGDPSSAAFPLVAALLVPGTRLTIAGVGLNPLRTGLIDTLLEMGADIAVEDRRTEGGEPVGDLVVSHGPLRAVDVPPRAGAVDDRRIPRPRRRGRLRLGHDADARIEGAAGEGKRPLGRDGEPAGRERGFSRDRRRRSFRPWHRTSACGRRAGGDRDGSSHRDERAGARARDRGAGRDRRFYVHRNEFSRFRRADERRRRRYRSGGPVSGPMGGPVIAIDGPAAAGKGTLARRIAAALGLPYLDTGLLYRAAGRRVLDAGGDPADPAAAEAAARALEPADLDRTDLRGPEADRAAAAVAAIPAVRQALLDFQRNFARHGGAVLDGRDIGTVVFPNADVKLFVTASVETRARRRWLELRAKGTAADLAVVETEMRARDAQDIARTAAPLRPAGDAVTLDTTVLDPDAAVAAAIGVIRQRWPGNTPTRARSVAEVAGVRPSRVPRPLREC